jgi:hypothetical protein
MITRTYVKCMLILLFFAITGSIGVYYQGEDALQIADRLIKFIPAVLMLTFLWLITKKNKNISKR